MRLGGPGQAAVLCVRSVLPLLRPPPGTTHCTSPRGAPCSPPCRRGDGVTAARAGRGICQVPPHTQQKFMRSLTHASRDPWKNFRPLNSSVTAFRSENSLAELAGSSVFLRFSFTDRGQRHLQCVAGHCEASGKGPREGNSFAW